MKSFGSNYPYTLTALPECIELRKHYKDRYKISYDVWYIKSVFN